MSENTTPKPEASVEAARMAAERETARLEKIYRKDGIVERIMAQETRTSSVLSLTDVFPEGFTIPWTVSTQVKDKKRFPDKEDGKKSFSQNVLVDVGGCSALDVLMFYGIPKFVIVAYQDVNRTLFTGSAVKKDKTRKVDPDPEAAIAQLEKSNVVLSMRKSINVLKDKRVRSAGATKSKVVVKTIELDEMTPEERSEQYAKLDMDAQAEALAVILGISVEDAIAQIAAVDAVSDDSAE